MLGFAAQGGSGCCSSWASRLCSTSRQPLAGRLLLCLLGVLPGSDCTAEDLTAECATCCRHYRHLSVLRTVQGVMRALSGLLLLQACKRPQPSTGSLACLLSTLLGSMLRLDGLTAAAAARKPPAAASAWLHAHLNGSLMQRCANCARVIAEQYRTASLDAQLVLHPIRAPPPCSWSVGDMS